MKIAETKIAALVEKIPEKKFLWLLFAAGLLIRLFIVLRGYRANVMADFADDIAYMNLAVNMIQQGFFVTDLQQLGTYSSVVGPGIGMLLYIPALIGGGDWLPVFIVVAAATAGIPVFIYLAGKEYFNRTVAFAAAIWAMIYVPFYKNIASAGKDHWMTLGFIIFLWHFGKYLFIKTDIQFKRIIQSGLIYGFLILLDERFLVLSPVFFFAIVLFKKNNSKYSIRQAILFTVTIIVVLIPWTVRNYIVYERFILVSVRTAPITEKIFGLSHVEYFPIDPDAWYVSPAVIDSIQKGLKEHETETGEYLSRQQVEGIRMGILPHKFSTGEYLLSNFIEFWQPLDVRYSYKQDGYRFDGKWSMMHNISIFFSYGILIPLMLIGLIRYIRNNRSRGMLILSIILIYMIFHIVMIPFTEYRYRMPLDGILILLAFYGLLSRNASATSEESVS